MCGADQYHSDCGYIRGLKASMPVAPSAEYTERPLQSNSYGLDSYRETA